MKPNLAQIGRFFLPYCIHEIEPNKFVLLNREYNNVGHVAHQGLGENWTEHDTKTGIRFIVEKPLTPAQRAKITGDNPRFDHGNFIFLYNDGSNPMHSAANMKAYLKRFEALMKIWARPETEDEHKAAIVRKCGKVACDSLRKVAQRRKQGVFN